MKPEEATTLIVCGYEITLDKSDYAYVVYTNLHINKGIKSSVRFEHSKWIDGRCKMIRLENLLYGNQWDIKVGFKDGNYLNFQKHNLYKIRPKMY